MKRTFVMILVLILIFSISACDNNPKITTAPAQTSFSSLSPIKTPEPTIVPTDNRSAGPRPTESNPNGTNKIGDIFTFDEWDASVTSYEFVTTVNGKDGTVVNTAPEGMTYILVHLEVTNNSNTASSFALDLSELKQKTFQIFYNLSVVCEMSSIFQGDDLMSKNIPAFSTGTGYFIFVAPIEVVTSTKSLHFTGGTAKKVITVKLR